MNKAAKKTRKIALSLLAIWSYNLIAPVAVYALTSGPSQPEVKGFQPAGVSDMVDLQTGDFKYSIPLLDIDGYPVNLSYQSGTSVDDEASWVGLGWSLNVGSINRQVRGVPDDMDGDQVSTEHYTKPKITVGGRATVKGELAGGDVPVGVQGSFSMGVFNDNYTGIGAEVGANAGISASLSNDGPLTAGLGVGLLSNTQSGVDVTPYANLGVKYSSDFGITSSAGLSASLGYNTRSGLKNLSLSCSFGPPKMESSMRFEGTLISYNTEPIFPKIQVPYKSSYGSFSMDLGVNYGIAFAGGGGAGYRSVKEIVSRVNKNPVYGTLYAEHGKNVKNAVMDFMREKDNPIIPELPNLAVPVNTFDLFSYTSQAGSGQFRLHRGGTGAFFDPEVADQSSTETLGFDAGAGGYVHGGTTFFKQKTTNTTRKWGAENDYLANGDFQDIDMNNPGNQHVYFKKVGELTREDAVLSGRLHGTEALAVKISGSAATNAFESYPFDNLTRIMKTSREPLQTSISYLTAKEASLYGLDKMINVYSPYTYNSGGFTPPPGHKPVPAATPFIKRMDSSDPANFRMPSHISEMTVTDEQGKKMVYGIPVYSRQQEEYTFAVGKNPAMTTPDQVTFPAGTVTDPAVFSSNKGIDYYYHKESQPAYATSFLLSGILSPDYVDKKGDGITDDDLGTAIKFNYSRIDAVNWRTPYQNATLNKGLLADEDDDKATIVYGVKEQYYISSIESKTKIAYFITQNRDDALGVLGRAGGVASDVSSPRQLCLREIRLYSKADMTKPIKVVKLNYDYSLCPNTANSIASPVNTDRYFSISGPHGKLTLTDIHFEYGNTTKGANFPYVFAYNTSYKDAGGTLRSMPGDRGILGYKTQNTDRWGTFRPNTDIPGFTAGNDEFPYTAQELVKGAVTASVGTAASLWHLSKITLPTGGIINVNYESDDYAYVQDKKATYMTRILDLQTDATPATDASNTTRANLVDAKVITLQLPATADNSNATAAFKRDYLNGSDYIYIKAFVDVGTSNSTHTAGKSSDFVSCFAEINSVAYKNNIARIRLKDRTEGGAMSNPIVVSAWQKMKEEYPRYAYPGFDRRIGNEGATAGLASAVQAIFNAFGNLSELTENFYHKAARLRYAGTMDYSKSFARIVKQDGFKLGGGVRVKSVIISDSWNTMSGGANTHTYGQTYDYTTTEGTQTISSGVATYEPSVGNDENPLKQPVFYVQQVRGGIDNFFDLEEPFGESFYPSPAINYSKVTVTDLDPDHPAGSTPQTGYTVNEFYTAKDFPVRVTVLPMQRYNLHPTPHFSIVAGSSTEKMVLSQGYAIELNDMSGKTKAVSVFNQSGSMISSSVYNYNTTPAGAGPLRLANTVNIVNQDGSVSQNQVTARDVDFFTDFREQESINDGKSVDVGVDVIPAFGYPIPIPHWPGSGNSEYKLFRSACAVKVSQYYGIVKSVVKTVNGSSIITENLAYDGITGAPVVTRTQNEFNKDIFSVNIPAYWAYSGMGPAYQSQGVILTGVTSGVNGVLAGQSQYLKEGDEFIDLDDNSGPYWVVKDYVSFPFTPGSAKYVMDRYGQTSANHNFNRIKIISSGYKNMLGSGLSNLVCLKNPLVNITGSSNLKLALANADLTSFKFINASAKTYSETWSTEVPDIHVLPVNTAPYNLAIGGGGAIQQNNNGTTLVGSFGAGHKYTTSDHNDGTKITSSNYFDARLTRSSIMDISHSLINYTNTNIMGAYGTFYAPRTGTYFVGFDSSIPMSWSLDCGGPMSMDSKQDPGIFGWTIIQVTLNKGPHVINVELHYDGVQPPSSVGGGVEIYNNTQSEILNPGDGSIINTIWSTSNLITTPGTSVYVRPNGGTTFIYNSAYSDPVQTPFSPCKVPIKSINPYLYGFLGNWRPFETKVFQQNRVYNNILNGANNVVDVKNSGYLANFVPYWLQPAAGGLTWLPDNSATSKWITANTVTGYDKYGQEIENKDALIRFSAAKFDFNGELPAAVASNARNREIYAAGFEDVNFKPGQLNYFDPPKVNDFLDENGNTIKSLAGNTDAHSGNYSAVLPAHGVTMRTIVYNAEPNHTAWLLADASKQWVKNTNTDNYGIYPNGFEPMFGDKKKYLFDAWVKDANPYDKSLALTLSVNGTPAALNVKAVVEGWKLVEGVIDLSGPSFTENSALELQIKPVAGAVVNIDDIRMHPLDAQLKSYVYDESTLRLMAELDENAFTSFYEYDSEGLLIRVKKETERGISTLKETRSSQKKY